MWSWYTGRWWVGCYIWYSEEGTGRGPSPPRPLFAVPNVTAHPSTASVPITVLLYNGPLLCGFNVPVKGLIIARYWQLSIPSYFLQRNDSLHYVLIVGAVQVSQVLLERPARSARSHDTERPHTTLRQSRQRRQRHQGSQLVRWRQLAGRAR